jgi:hypothetical protein
MVPVLSKTITSISFVFSNVSAFLINIQFFAHTQVPTIIAVGVANHNAHGQAITRVATADIIAILISQEIKYQLTNVIIEITIIIGTNIPETLSANFCIGAFELCASFTIFIIEYKVQFSFILVTFICNNPSILIVAQNTSESSFLKTGIDSHVSILSSIEELPFIIIQSRAIFSHVFTIIISHTFILSISFSIILLQTNIFAFFTHNSNNFQIASHAFVFALYSKYFHKLIKVIIDTAASKKTHNQ